jgi:hypothetical protein
VNRSAGLAPAELRLATTISTKTSCGQIRAADGAVFVESILKEIRVQAGVLTNPISVSFG